MNRLLFALLILFCFGSPAFAFDPFQVAGIDPHPGAKLPLDRTFRDESGKTVTLGGLVGGKPVLLIPVQHNCPNLCSVTLGNLMQSVEAQPLKPGRDFTMIAFGIDPKEGHADASAALQRLLTAFPDFPKNAIHALTGTPTDIAAVTGALGYRYAWDAKLGQYDHVAATAVLTPEGALSHWLYGVAPQPKDIELALTEAAAGKAASWGDQLLLLCYHYDPATGRYNSLIWAMLRGFSAVMAAAIVLIIAGFAYREFGKPAGDAK